MNQLQGANFCATNSGWAAGTTSTTSVASAVVYCVNGKVYNKQAASNAAAATTDLATGVAFNPVPANYGCVFVACLEAGTDAAVKIVQGEVVPLDSAGNFITNPEFPVLPNSATAIGYTIIKAGATYVATTTGWQWGVHNMSSVTGMTYTFVPVMVLPDRPQAS